MGHLVIWCNIPRQGRLSSFIQAVVSNAEDIVTDLDEMSLYAQSVDMCIAESHADVECVDILQGITEASSNPCPVEQVIVTDRSEDHCMDELHEITKFGKSKPCHVTHSPDY